MKTAWKVLPDQSTMRVEYGFHTTNHTYFSITAEIRDKSGREDSFGCLHDEIRRFFPELSPLIKWHLCDSNGTPMHYVANSIYWLQQKNYDHFKSICVYGVLPSDSLKQPKDCDEVWLNNRLPLLQAAFTQDMIKFHLLEASP